MSSYVSVEGAVAAAVALPFAAAYGAAWLLFQSGKMIVEGVSDVVNDFSLEIEASRQRKAEKEKLKASNLRDRERIQNLCSSLETTLDDLMDKVDYSGINEVVSIREELSTIQSRIISGKVFNDEAENRADLDQISKLKNRVQQLGQKTDDLKLQESFAILDLMEELRISVSRENFDYSVQNDVVTSDPDQIERQDLIDRLSSVSKNIITALKRIKKADEEYCFTNSDILQLRSCFNGVGADIQKLSGKATTIPLLKSGIKRLEKSYDFFTEIYPSMEIKAKERGIYYQAYLDGAKALGESIKPVSYFSSISLLKDELEKLKARAQRAEKCAQIYRKLGRQGYLCYAWDTELKAKGYNVRSRQTLLNQFDDFLFEHKKTNSGPLPFYEWDSDSLTQFYKLSESSSVQLKVDNKGAVSMQVLSDYDDTERTVFNQNRHCSQIKAIYENLKKNWFIDCETTDEHEADIITTVDEWRELPGNSEMRLVKNVGRKQNGTANTQAKRKINGSNSDQ